MPGPDPFALEFDVFKNQWPNKVYAFLPINLIDKFIQTFLHQNIDFGFLICPFWPSQSYFPILLDSLIDDPLIFPASLLDEASLLPKRISISGVQHFFKLCSIQGISTETCACLLRSLESNTLCAYTRTWKDFASWCNKQEISYG